MVKRAESGDASLLHSAIEAYGEAMDEMIRLNQISESTVKRRVDFLVSFITHAGNKLLRIEELKPYHVTDWLKTKTTWNATTQHSGASTVKMAISWARKEGRIDSNPLEFLSVKKGPPRDFLVSDELFEKLLVGVSDTKCRRRRGDLIPNRPNRTQALWLSPRRGSAS